MESLYLIFLFKVQVGQAHKNVRIRRDFSNQYVLPFDGVTRLLTGLLRIRDLPHDLRRVPDDRLDLFLSLDGFGVTAQSAVDQSQVVDGLYAVGFYSYGF